MTEKITCTSALVVTLPDATQQPGRVLTMHFSQEAKVRGAQVPDPTQVGRFLQQTIDGDAEIPCGPGVWDFVAMEGAWWVLEDNTVTRGLPSARET